MREDHAYIDLPAALPRGENKQAQEQQPGYHHGDLRESTQAKPSTATMATARPIHSPFIKVKTNVAVSVARTSNPDTTMAILPGSVSGTCRVDGQDEGARRNDGEQHNSPGHHADVRHVTQGAVREGKKTVEPPDWRQRHGGPRQSGQSLGRVRPRLEGGHVDVTGQVPTIRVARFGGPGLEAKVTILDSPGNRPSRLGVPGRHGFMRPRPLAGPLCRMVPRMLVRSRLRWASALPLRRQSPGIRGRGCRRVPLIPSAATGNVASFSEADAAVDGRLIRLSAYPHRLVTGTLGAAQIGEFCASVRACGVPRPCKVADRAQRRDQRVLAGCAVVARACSGATPSASDVRAREQRQRDLRRCLKRSPADRCARSLAGRPGRCSGARRRLV